MFNQFHNQVPVKMAKYFIREILSYDPQLARVTSHQQNTLNAILFKLIRLTGHYFSNQFLPKKFKNFFPCLQFKDMLKLAQL